MKKWLAALLTLCLTLSMLPAALAEDVSAAVDAPVEEIELALGDAADEATPEAEDAAPIATADSAQPDDGVYSDGDWDFNMNDSPAFEFMNLDKGNWVYSNGNWYFYTDGSPASGVLGVINGDAHDGWYYFEPGTGKMLTGWQYDTVNKCWLYFDPKPNKAHYAGTLRLGWVYDGGKWYYVNDATTSKYGMAIGWDRINGKWYFFNVSGEMQTGYQKIDNNGRLVTGWAVPNAHYYYFRSSGEMTTGWQQLDGWWYFFKSTGAAATYWEKIEGKWYFFNDRGMMQTDWKLIGGKWYFFDLVSGVMATFWKKIECKWYYFGADGAMRTYWQKIGGKWYYFDADGAMRTYWQKIDGKWYYFDADGAMRTGWRKIDGKWYYFDANGVLRSTRQDTSMDLTQYLEKDIYATAKLFGFKVRMEGSAADVSAGGNNIYFFSFGEWHNLIGQVSINGSSKYNIFGVTYGMDQAAAQTALSNAGAVYDFSSNGTLYYTCNGDLDVSVTIKNGKVSRIYAGYNSNVPL